MRNVLVSVSLSAVVAVGCVSQQEEVPGDVTDAVEAQAKTAPVIVGGVNWTETSSLPATDFFRQKARPVALLWLPALGSRCTGFLITPDVLMTNHHCVSSTSGAQGAYAVFDAEAGIPESMRDTVDCSQFLGANEALDFGLLRCTGRPGDRHGVVELSEATPAVGAAITVIHQNCDYYSNPSCNPDKKLSRGTVSGSTSTDIKYDADTLGGSSGSAVFDEQGRVIALHHVGVGGDGNGRGSYNTGVKMSLVLANLRSNFGSIFTVDTMQPSPGTDPVVTPPADPTRDRLEPNNDTGSATAITLPYAANNLFVASADRDQFKFTLTRRTTVTIQLNFSHAAGDLDLYLYRSGNAQPVGRSEGTTNTERIRLTLSAGTYNILALGYGTATGAYSITVQ